MFFLNIFLYNFWHISHYFRWFFPIEKSSRDRKKFTFNAQYCWCTEKMNLILFSFDLNYPTWTPQFYKEAKWFKNESNLMFVRLKLSNSNSAILKKKQKYYKKEANLISWLPMIFVVPLDWAWHFTFLRSN